MSIKTQIKKLEQYEVNHRSTLARAGALVLTMATLFSLTDLGAHSTQKQLARHDVIVQSSVIVSPAEKNETVRMPIKFDEGLRSVATTGQ